MRTLKVHRKCAFNKAFKSDSATRASFASLTVWHALRHALTRRYTIKSQILHKLGVRYENTINT